MTEIQTLCVHAAKVQPAEITMGEARKLAQFGFLGIKAVDILATEQVIQGVVYMLEIAFLNIVHLTPRTDSRVCFSCQYSAPCRNDRTGWITPAWPCPDAGGCGQQPPRQRAHPRCAGAPCGFSPQ